MREGRESWLLRLSSARIAAQRTWGLTSVRLAKMRSVSRERPDSERFSMALQRTLGFADLSRKLASHAIRTPFQLVVSTPPGQSVFALYIKLLQPWRKARGWARVVGRRRHAAENDSASRAICNVPKEVMQILRQGISRRDCH